MKVFEYKLDILEKHLDTFGHVNNATYLELYEEARWDIIASRGFSLEEIQRNKLGPVVLDLNLKFQAELRNRESITVVSKVIGMKNKYAMEMEQQMIKSDGRVASSMNITFGLFDLKERKLIKPTPEWNNAIGFE
jgi:acyl-CoA thioester hydrolase